MNDLLAQYAGHPALQIAVLFIGPFVLEEAALVGGAAVAAAGELPYLSALTALYLGIVISDWALYGVGMLAGRSRRVRRFIGESNINYGRSTLHKGALPAALTARLVPWLLLPIFVASGFLRVGFARFAAVNALIAFVYANVIFWTLYRFEVFLFDALDGWGWLVVLALVLVVVAASRAFAKRHSSAE